MKTDFESHQLISHKPIKQTFFIHLLPGMNSVNPKPPGASVFLVFLSNTY